MDTADLIEECELEMWRVIYQMHDANIRYEVIYQVLNDVINQLEVKARAEHWLMHGSGG